MQFLRFQLFVAYQSTEKPVEKKDDEKERVGKHRFELQYLQTGSPSNHSTALCY